MVSVAPNNAIVRNCAVRQHLKKENAGRSLDFVMILAVPAGSFRKHESAHPFDLVAAAVQGEVVGLSALLEELARPWRSGRRW
jgi:hypothetical protein